MSEVAEFETVSESEEQDTEALSIGWWIANAAKGDPERLAELMAHIQDGIEMQDRQNRSEGRYDV